METVLRFLVAMASTICFFAGALFLLLAYVMCQQEGWGLASVIGIGYLFNGAVLLTISVMLPVLAQILLELRALARQSKSAP